MNDLQGATIKTDEETGKIIIARIMHGGAADRSGLIHVGDEVIEVNGINVEGKTPNDVLAILVGIWKTIKFVFWRSNDRAGFAWFCSKTPRVLSTSSFCRRTRKAVSASPRYACAPTSTTIRRTIRTFRARRPDCSSYAVMSCILCHRWISNMKQCTH